MKRIFSLILCCLLFTGNFVEAQTQKVEITKFDITRMKNFRADKISVFGVYLGMPMNAVKNKLFKDQRVVVALGKKEPLIVKIFDRTPEGKMNKLIAKCTWKSTSGGLQEIKILQAFEPYLKGSTKQLLHTAAITPSSYIRKSFLGKPDKFAQKDFSSFINLITTKYWYYSKWLMVEKSSVGEKVSVVFALVKMK